MHLVRKTFCIGFFIFLCAPIFSQTHTSVPLENKIYLILEQAQMRGLCAPLPGARPYSQDVIVSAIREILDADDTRKIKDTEREILEQYIEKFSKPKIGIDWRRGGYYNEVLLGENETLVSANLSIGADIEGSAGFYSSFSKQYFGTETWLQVYLNGDLGKNVSYGFTVEGGLMRAPRNYLGLQNTYYEDFIYNADNFDDPGNKEFVNRKHEVYSEPLTHFPYSYEKRWDGSVFEIYGNLDNYSKWPLEVSGGYSMLSEISASFLENKMLLKLGRLSHDWGSIPLGSSLAFNKTARPFLGIETAFYPVSWFGAASLTGLLEYNNIYGIKASSRTFQNAFSITMLQFKYKNYLFFDFVDAVVWPKRFELGYISPITSNFFYQNNIGDFDNMAISLNLRAQYPGLGNIWGSFFMDEMNFTKDLLTLDRQMFSWQAGMNFPLPFLSFSSVKFSYTKVNPYCYTHNRNFNPWYGDLSMETSYTNNGVGLGYYLPPNSDEILVRFSTMPVKTLYTSLQYQLIRHGADFGSRAVDGSNLLSELAPSGRDDNPVLKRFFLKDGAYQWMNIIRLGGEWTPEKAPFAFYCEIGAVISFFTDIKEKANSGSAHDYSVIDTPEYPKSTGFIAKLGFRLYPR